MGLADYHHGQQSGLVGRDKEGNLADYHHGQQSETFRRDKPPPRNHERVGCNPPIVRHLFGMKSNRHKSLHIQYLHYTIYIDIYNTILDLNCGYLTSYDIKIIIALSPYYIWVWHANCCPARPKSFGGKGLGYIKRPPYPMTQVERSSRCHNDIYQADRAIPSAIETCLSLDDRKIRAKSDLKPVFD